MTRLRVWWSRALDPVLRGRRERQLSEEIQAHLDGLTAEHIARGMTPEAARLAARRDFGGVDQVKAVYRDHRGLPLVDALAQDVRYGIRMFGRERALTLTAILTLGIGIGANNVAFTFLNATMLRSLPVRDGHEIVYVGSRDRVRNLARGASFQDYQAWKAAPSLTAIAAMRGRQVVIGDEHIAADQIAVQVIEAHGFDLLDIAPQIGRGLRPEDDREGAAPVVVLADSLWKRRYGGDPAIVGRTIRLASVPTTVIGVMPPGEGFPHASDAWQPLFAVPGAFSRERATRTLTVFGRLAPGASVASAQRELDVIGERAAQAFPDTNADIRVHVQPFTAGWNQGFWQILPALLLVVGLVLALACAHTANLLLARAANRSREIALRVAIGASRARIVRQLMIESLVLALAAGAVACLVSMAGIRFIDYTMAEIVLPAWLRFTMDLRVLIFFAALCFLTPAVFGLLPALHLSKNRGGELLKEGARGTSSARRVQRWTGGLVVAEIGLSLVILVCTGILIRTMVSLQAADSIVDLEHLVTAELGLPATYKTAEARLALLDRLQERVDVHPAVAAADVASEPPFSGLRTSRRLLLQHQPIDGDASAPSVGVAVIGSRYFDALGVRVLRGRSFDVRDRSPGSGTAIVNERFAAAYFPRADALGGQIRLVDPAAPAEEGPWLTVVGVSPSVRQAMIKEADPVVYLPYRGESLTSTFLIVRASGPDVVAALRQELRALDANIPLVRPQRADQMLSTRLFQHRLFSGLFTMLAIVALLVSTAGLYVITAHAVSTRTQEIGVRLAIGASGGSISWLVGRRALVLTVLGCLAGAAGAYWSRGLMAIFVAEASANDWTLFALIAMFLSAVAMAAAMVPARAASRLDPVTALRHE